VRFKKDQISSILLLFVAGVLLIASVNASVGSFGEPGSGLVPFLAAFLLGIFSLLNLVLSSLKKAKEKEKPLFPSHEMNWKNLIMTLGALFAFPLLLKLLGFNLTVFGFMFFLAKAIEPRRWVIAVLFALSTTIACYLLFVYWLKFVVEKGVLGI
jgi:hypothetical protein